MSIREIDLAQFNEFARQQSIQVHENPEHSNPQVARARAYVEILAQQQGVVPIQTAEDLRFDFLNSSDELEDFLGAIQAARQQDKVRDPPND